MRYFAVILLLLASSALAQSPENLLPTDTLEDPNYNWLSTESNHVTAVTDATDGTYVYANTAGQVARFRIANNTGIPGGATVDSIIVKWRGQDNGTGSNRQRIRLRMDGNANYCDGANVSVGASWADYEDIFTQAPSTAGTCGNSWDTDKVDSVNVQLTCTALGASREVQVTELDVDVYYTEAGGAIKGRRRSILVSYQFPNPDDWIYGYNKSRFWLWAS